MMLFAELPLETILGALFPSSSSLPTTSYDNDTFNFNSTNQTLTISDLIEALSIIQNNNSDATSISCPPNESTNGQNIITSSNPSDIGSGN